VADAAGISKAHRPISAAELVNLSGRNDFGAPKMSLMFRYFRTPEVISRIVYKKNRRFPDALRDNTAIEYDCRTASLNGCIDTQPIPGETPMSNTDEKLRPLPRCVRRSMSAHCTTAKRGIQEKCTAWPLAGQMIAQQAPAHKCAAHPSTDYQGGKKKNALMALGFDAGTCAEMELPNAPTVLPQRMGSPRSRWTANMPA